MFVKSKYDIFSFASKSFSSNIHSVLGRIRNQFAKALTEQAKLPKICIFIIDDDILRHLKINDETKGITTILTVDIGWLFSRINRMIKSRKEQLEEKAIRPNYPQVYWLEAPQHIMFKNNLARRKLNSVVQNEAAKIKDFKIIRMKKHWDPDNGNLFFNNRYTAEGLMRYWESMDSSVEFNDKKAEQKQSGLIQGTQSANQANVYPRYHWHNNSDFDSNRNGRQGRNNGFRFKLPKPN